MGQIGFFDLSKRYTGLDAKNEPLAKIDEVVPWEDFRGCLDAVCRRSDKARKSRAGRKPWDAVVMFKTIILSALYNLSDDQVEHQIRDRLSFMRFLGLGLVRWRRFVGQLGGLIKVYTSCRSCRQNPFESISLPLLLRCGDVGKARSGLSIKSTGGAPR